MPRRSFVARGAAAVGALAAGPLALAGRAGAQGVGKGELGVAGVDHVGITVPDLNQAVEWFEDILGAVAPLSFGPFAGSFLEGALDVPGGRRSTASRRSASGAARTSSSSPTRRPTSGTACR